MRADVQTLPLTGALGTAARSLLRTSTDLSRVTVRRADPQTKEPRVLTYDLRDYRSTMSQQHLWLRDGDEIEVPEKP